MLVSKTVSFDAAHKLPYYQGKCKNLHGHRWTVELVVEGPVGKDGIAIDFKGLKEALVDIVSPLDHSFLNDFIPNPTAENLAIYIGQKLKSDPIWYQAEGDIPYHLGFTKIRWIQIWETPDSYVRLEGSELNAILS